MNTYMSTDIIEIYSETIVNAAYQQIHTNNTFVNYIILYCKYT